jgi:retron-type reverse transcriptase
VISPLLANVYLHYTLDLWFERGFRKTCKGVSCFIRYADDCVPRRHARVHSTQCSYAA